jgi:hypothetical protein
MLSVATTVTDALAFVDKTWPGCPAVVLEQYGSILNPEYRTHFIVHPVFVERNRHAEFEFGWGDNARSAWRYVRLDGLWVKV